MSGYNDYQSVRDEVERLASIHPETTPERLVLQDDSAIRADEVYATLADAGAVSGEKLIWPSVRLAQEQRRAADGEQVVSMSDTSDPAVALRDFPELPGAVREAYWNVDEFPEYNRASVKWLGFASVDAGLSYVSSKGAYVEVAGPGEGLGETWERTFLHNPHFAGEARPQE